MRLFNGFLAALLAILIPGNLAQASFHLMQIEQVIGGVNGDTTAQAVQLRMRSSGQNLVSQSQIKVFDATGSNPILLKDMTTNVSVSTGGSRILLTTPNFANYTNIPLVTNFVMDNVIPASYLAAGSLTFEDDFGSVYWSLSWGGSGYTGSTTGLTTAQGGNDADGNFSPSFAGPLPSTTLQCLDFTGNATALSTNNAAQYVVTAGAATFINNAGTSFVVTAPPPTGLDGDYNGNEVVDSVDYTVWRDAMTAGSSSLTNDSTPGVVNEDDFIYWRDHYGDVPGGGAGAASAAVPEPASCVLLILGGIALWVSAARRRR